MLFVPIQQMLDSKVVSPARQTACCLSRQHRDRFRQHTAKTLSVSALSHLWTLSMVGQVAEMRSPLMYTSAIVSTLCAATFCMWSEAVIAGNMMACGQSMEKSALSHPLSKSSTEGSVSISSDTSKRVVSTHVASAAHLYSRSLYLHQDWLATVLALAAGSDAMVGQYARLVSQAMPPACSSIC